MAKDFHLTHLISPKRIDEIRDDIEMPEFAVETLRLSIILDPEMFAKQTVDMVALLNNQLESQLESQLLASTLQADCTLISVRYFWPLPRIGLNFPIH